MTDRGFHVAHQKVSIDVNLADHSLEGWTELTINPLEHLKIIRLDSRQCDIHSVLVNGRKTQFYSEDALRNAKMFKGSNVHQHHQYRNQLEGLMQPTLQGDLIVNIPKGFRFMQDTSSTGVAYHPITLKIDFSLRDPKTGVNFVGGQDSNIRKEFWHAYTTHSPIGQATSNWIPCVDGLWEPCTWQIEISVPRTVGDIMKKKDNSNNEETADAVSKDNEMNDNDSEDDDNEHDNNEDLEILVVGNNTASSEIAHPFDERKKVVSFDMFTPVSPQHIGFAVGAFVQTPITPNDDDDDEMNDKDDNSVPIYLYTFPHQVNDALNSCAFLHNCLGFFTNEYGSYPFSTYSLCFVNDLETDVASAMGLSLCSDKLLFPPQLIDPLFIHSETLVIALATQWCGVNIVPKSWSDLWVTIGVSRYMSNSYLRKLLGNNEYRFRLKKRAQEITRVDINKPPLAAPQLNFPLVEEDLSFLKLKAPLILFILDRRMTKTDRSLGLSRVLPKLFLQAMSEDLSNSCVSTAQFIRLCERVSHNRLDSFFDQWVFASGYPIFRVTQRFNKKRMFVEMGIRQVQNSEVGAPVMDKKDFVNDAKAVLDSDPVYPVQPIFTGPMTIRIHEADGTPYEHVVDIKENFTKLDIQYNTKYKRLKRKKNPPPAVPGAAGASAQMGDLDDMDGVLLHSLGDVLQSPAEMKEWNLTDWTEEQEERMVNEAFEWIRVDSDFEWICKLYINQPDYMFCSQLQQDRDVVAQYDAIEYFKAQRPSQLYSSILVRTLMDRRYYYGLRVEAAHALVEMAVEDTDFIGKTHLLKAFQVLYCFPGSTIPRANDFSDFTSYFIQKAIPQALSKIRHQGVCPPDVRNFLLDLLRYNENSSNEFSDSYYVCTLIVSLVNSLIKSQNMTFDDDETTKDSAFINKVVSEIDRCCRLDGWIPSNQNMVTVTSIGQKERLVLEGLCDPSFEGVIQYTRKGNNNDVRVAAFQYLLDLGAIRSKALLHYALTTSTKDSSVYVRNRLIFGLRTAIGLYAIRGTGGSRTQKGGAQATGTQGGAMMVIDGKGNAMAQRQEALARSSVKGAIELIRKEFESENQFKQQLWMAINDRHYGIISKRILLDICQVLYKAADSFIVTLPTPRPKKLVAKHLGQGKMVIKREGRLKIQILSVKGANGTVKKGKKEKKEKKEKKQPKIKLKVKAL
uniref:Transcription initiation factor TFIID subunit 2 n=1 Tax=Blastobotrys adeninivorans TaxID=409370 RepID=A0A060T3I1_BLAAD